jgi:CheY-like chemotaxis protein
VAFVDIGLPVMDGLELARRIRRLPDRAATRLVAMTGYGQAEDRARSREAGFDVHLVKPVEMDAVMAQIDQVRAPAGSVERS